MSGGGDEQCECPLCMEPLEIDDFNFYPCTCGYQICRFCWHRIRTDENGLCPACRKQYPEDPAEFKPLTEDELQRIKKERRQKDIQRKQKAAENRKHLANVRVVQRNLVFVVGLSQRLAEPDVLKKHEYFGKFGKIHKVVINQSTSYAGAQGPSASAYVTYHKSDDALKAILAVNNVHIDGRTLKASLGTTKYCSHFLRGTQCPKSDCMYLHELGEEAASFTKEEMQVGKHQEYEQRLLEQHMNSQNAANSQHTSNNKACRRKNSSPTNIVQPQGTPPPQQLTPPTGSAIPPPSQISPAQPQVPPPVNGQSNTPPQLSPPNTANSDAWPSLQPSNSNKQQTESLANGSSRSQSSNYTNSISQTCTADKNKPDPLPDQSRAPGNPSKIRTMSETDTLNRLTDSQSTKPTVNTSTTCIPQSIGEHLHINSVASSIPPSTVAVGSLSPHHHHQQITSSTHSLMGPVSSTRKSLGLDSPDSLSLFSSVNGYHGARNPKPPAPLTDLTDIPTTEMSEVIPVSSYTDWQAAFGFSSKSSSQDIQDDDLGFDPLEESSRGLADLLEKENGQRHINQQKTTDLFNGFPTATHTSRPMSHRPQNLPPGFSLNHVQQTVPAPAATLRTSHVVAPPSQSSTSSSQLPVPPPGHTINTSTFYRHTDVLTSRMMGFMSTGMPTLPNTYGDLLSDLPGNKDHLQQNSQNDCYNMKDWQDGLRALLPNINISFGGQQQQQAQQQTQPKAPDTRPNSQHNTQKSAMLGGNTQHWLKSFNQFTDLDTSPTNHRLPFVQQFPVRNNVWQPQTHNPPPGFQTHIRPPLQTTEAHKLTEGLQ